MKMIHFYLELMLQEDVLMTGRMNFVVAQSYLSSKVAGERNY
jgi:hypothetical protein